MMNTAHAPSGAAVWLSGCAALTGLGHRPAVDVIVVGAAVCAGWAIVPDIDCPNSTVARSGGIFTQAIAVIVGRFGAFVHARTRTVHDPADLDGHRTVTHTIVWALLCGGMVALFERWGGPWAAALTVFIAVHLGIKAALPPSRRWFWMPTGLAYPRRVRMSVSFISAVALAAIAHRMAPQSGWWLGLAVAVGSLVHCLGDCMTNSACPLLWPLPIGRAKVRRRWYPVGPPARFRFTTGGLVERHVVRPVLVFAVAAALVLCFWPDGDPDLAGIAERMTKN